MKSPTRGQSAANNRGLLSPQSASTTQFLKEPNGDAYWIAYDVLSRLCEEFVQSGITVVLDMTMGWAFQVNEHQEQFLEKWYEFFSD